MNKAVLCVLLVLVVSIEAVEVKAEKDSGQFPLFKPISSRGQLREKPTGLLETESHQSTILLETSPRMKDRFLRGVTIDQVA